MNNTPVFKKSPLTAALATIISVCALPLTATAATRTWYGQHTSSGWNDVSSHAVFDEDEKFQYFLYKSNWVNLADNPDGSFEIQLPQSGDSLLFNGFKDPYNDLTNLIINGIGFAPGTVSHTLRGNPIISKGNIINSSGASQFIDMPISIGADQVWDGGGVAMFVNNVQVNEHHLIIQNGIEVSVTVSGAGSMTVNSDYFNIGSSSVLKIKDGGQVSAVDSYAFGNSAVTGAKSQWANSGRLIVGDELTIENGGQVSNTDGSLDGTGIVTITGINATTGVSSLWTSSGDLSVSGKLFVKNGGKVRDTSGFLGFTNMGVAEVTVTGVDSMWENSDSLSIGETGAGKMYIQNGGRVSNVNDGIIGVVSNSDGEVWVQDRGSVWSNNSYLVIGDSGKGTLTIENAGRVLSSDGYLGVETGGKGNAIITGVNSLWVNDGDLTVGYVGGGGLNIFSGGLATNSNGYLGRNSGGKGEATISGAKSRWENRLDLTVGENGTGKLNILDGGNVTSRFGVLGSQSGSNDNIATISATASQWEISNGLTVGEYGEGTLNLENGGKVTVGHGPLSFLGSVDSVLGLQAGSRGAAVVKGEGSLWESVYDLIVGDHGQASVTIRDGGKIVSKNGILGKNRAENVLNTVLVTGIDSTTSEKSRWTNSGNLIVGAQGKVELTISDGGQVDNVVGFLGDGEGSIGTVIVSGKDSLWANSGDLIVGNAGRGELNIENGGKVTNDWGYLGYFFYNGSGSATITGESSQWINRGQLRIGQSNKSTLKILNGGEVKNTYGFLQHFSTAIVDGEGSVWSNSSALTIGNLEGGGFLTVSNGGKVENADAYLGTASTESTATVSGLGSQWLNNGNLIIGDAPIIDGPASKGVLQISNGGKVSNINGILGYYGSTGIANVEDQGSEWVNINALFVGESGIGELTIRNGGYVSVGGTLNIGQWGTVNLNGGSLTATAAAISNGGHFYWTAGSLNIAGDSDFTLGENSSFAGFSSLGNGQTFAVNKNLNVNGKPLELSGGQAKAASLVLNGSGEVVGYGAVAADIAGGTSANTIAANGGSLSLGNVNSTTGFDYGGNLDVGSEQVTLLDKDQANLGVSTSISDGGKLITVNGADLGNGEMLNFVGNAGVVGNFTNNGVVSGSEGSLAFTNDVKGAGSFSGDIHFLAAYNPGNSPAAIDFNGGDASFASTSILTLEIFGNMPGSQYDQLLNINHLDFNGSLVLAFGNGFTPFAGESFDFFDFVSFTGSFDPNRIRVTGIDPNLLDFSSLAINGKLQVAAVPLPAGVWLFMTGLTVLLTGSRRNSNSIKFAPSSF